MFDEMNVVQIKKHVRKLYNTSYKIVLKQMTDIVNLIYEEIYDEALALGFDGDLRDLDEGWVEEFFQEYNPLTKFVFSNEFDRKESRLFESLVASTKERHQSYKTAERLLARQIKQYCIELEDKVLRTVYKDLGVKKVRWVTEQDHRTCGVCNELDGQIFDLDDAPPKQHWLCRCYLMPVRE